MTRTLTTLALVSGLLAALCALALAGRVEHAGAAIDCGTVVELRIEIVDNGNPNLNGGLLAKPGAIIAFNRNPQTGSPNGVDYRDNGSFDDEKARLGVVQENTACAASETDDYSAELRFDPALLSCEIISANRHDFGLEGDEVLTFTVDDCESSTPTPTPRPTRTPTPEPTATSVVVTATPTSTPVPSATPLPTSAPQQVIVLVAPTQAPVIAPAVSVPQQPVQGAPSSVIRPPNTGSGNCMHEACN